MQNYTKSFLVGGYEINRHISMSLLYLRRARNNITCMLKPTHAQL